MDTEIRSFLIGFRAAERLREAEDNRLASLARSRPTAVSRGLTSGSVRVGHHLGVLRSAGRRVVVAVVVLALGAMSVHPARAIAGVQVGSLITDPGLPLYAVAEMTAHGPWSCVGLPHPVDPTDRNGGRTVGDGARWARGTSLCVGSACTWELDDARLDGTIEATSGGCQRATAASTVRTTCRGGTIALTGRSGRWLGSWTAFAPHDRLVVLEGAGAFTDLSFVGHWTDAGAGMGRVTGLVTRRLGLGAAWREGLP